MVGQLVGIGIGMVVGIGIGIGIESWVGIGIGIGIGMWVGIGVGSGDIRTKHPRVMSSVGVMSACSY